MSLYEAYRVMFEQWRIVFEIGAANRAAGVQPTTFRELLRLVSRKVRRRPMPGDPPTQVFPLATPAVETPPL